MANVYEVLPEIMGEEQFYISSLIKNMDDKQAQQFANIYRVRRKDPQIILLVTLVGFLGIAGIQIFNRSDWHGNSISSHRRNLHDRDNCRPCKL